eukprot:CAMPEP_0206491924 /NCGR_PEP_ID=MMETSP0324_2-20121206/45551_1 /ASSEMBLY_ACC=CAM_ASM_000836 /TAXON_ID=2866 /ORGANISM="Crypthecodinium cohnii, Strain Seligo" /LENGTH=81 /DNA_ID=CAMNT_0053973739 /DNA_START=238 /DNA_END=483 /DNA_ORIENTATION=-
MCLDPRPGNQACPATSLVSRVSQYDHAIDNDIPLDPPAKPEMVRQWRKEHFFPAPPLDFPPLSPSNSNSMHAARPLSPNNL